MRDGPNGDLESFSLQRVRDIGIGRESDRRGLLIVYDLAAQRMRIEVGPQLECVFTDAFVGYLMRDNARAFFAARDPGFGLRTTLFMLQHRLREASLGMAYDPRAVSFITDSVRLAAGAGATAGVALGGDSSLFLSPLSRPRITGTSSGCVTAASEAMFRCSRRRRTSTSECCR